MKRHDGRTLLTPHHRVHRRLHGALGPGTRTVLLLVGASFLTDISSEMTLKLLPIFLTGTLGASVATVGLIEGIGESTASLTKLLGGRVSDRLPRRLPLVIAGYSLSAVTKPLFALVATAAPVGALRFGDRLGKGVREAPRDALIADAVPGERRGLAYGFHRAADTSGAVVGVLLVALILALIGGGAAVGCGGAGGGVSVQRSLRVRGGGDTAIGAGGTDRTTHTLSFFLGGLCPAPDGSGVRRGAGGYRCGQFGHIRSVSLTGGTNGQEAGRGLRNVQRVLIPRPSTGSGCAG